MKWGNWKLESMEALVRSRTMGVTGKKVQELGIGSRPCTIERAGPTDPISIRTFYIDFNTVFLLCLSCCLLLV